MSHAADDATAPRRGLEDAPDWFGTPDRNPGTRTARRLQMFTSDHMIQGFSGG